MSGKQAKAQLVSSMALRPGRTALTANVTPETLPQGQHMYIIERYMPGLGLLSPAELKVAAQKSCSVLRNLGPEITWLRSYITGGRMYCVFLAPVKAMVREHAQQGGLPATAVYEVSTIIGPTTAK